MHIGGVALLTFSGAVIANYVADRVAHEDTVERRRALWMAGAGVVISAVLIAKFHSYEA